MNSFSITHLTSLSRTTLILLWWLKCFCLSFSNTNGNSIRIVLSSYDSDFNDIQTLWLVTVIAAEQNSAIPLLFSCLVHTKGLPCTLAVLCWLPVEEWLKGQPVCSSHSMKEKQQGDITWTSCTSPGTIDTHTHDRICKTLSLVREWIDSFKQS